MSVLLLDGNEDDDSDGDGGQTDIGGYLCKRKSGSGVDSGGRGGGGVIGEYASDSVAAAFSPGSASAAVQCDEPFGLRATSALLRVSAVVPAAFLDTGTCYLILPQLRSMCIN